MGKKQYDKLAGRKFNRLRLLSLIQIRSSKNQKTLWECLCDCGNKKILQQTQVVCGRVKSCGCLQKEQASKASRKVKGRSGFNQIKRQYLNHAKKRNIQFLLNDEELENLLIQKCYYCKIKPIQISKYNGTRRTEAGIKHGQFIYNGVDRLNNEKYYSKENTVPCCKICNWMKSNLPYAEFIKHIKRIAENHESN